MTDIITTGPQSREIKSIRPLELFYLFQKLSVRQNISIKMRKSEGGDFGNYATVIRASNSLIMLRDHVTGEVEFLTELKNVSEFVLSKECLPYQAQVNYQVV